MNNQSTDNTNNNAYIRLADAARFVPYSKDYISLLARQGKIDARKIGRDWHTTQQAVEHYYRNQETRRSLLNTGRPTLAAYNGNEIGGEYESSSAPVFEPRWDDLKPEKFSYPAAQAPVAHRPVEPALRAVEAAPAAPVSAPVPAPRTPKGASTFSLVARIVIPVAALLVVFGGVRVTPADNMVYGVKDFVALAGEMRKEFVRVVEGGLVRVDEGGNMEVVGNVQAGGQLVSTIMDGVAPIVVKSTSTVENLSAQYLDGVQKGEINLAFVTRNGAFTAARVVLGGGADIASLVVEGTAQIATLSTNSLTAENAGIEVATIGTASIDDAAVTRATIQDLLVQGKSSLSDTDIDGTLDVSGTTTLRRASINGRLSVDGTLSVTDTISAPSISVGTGSFGNVDVENKISFTGSTTVNLYKKVNVSESTLVTDANLEVGGALSIAGAFTPATDNTQSMGSATLRWKDTFLGPEGVKIYNTTGTDAEYATLGYSANVITLTSAADGAGTARNFNITGGNVGIGTAAPDNALTIDDGSLSFSTAGGASDVVVSRGAANRLDVADGDSLRVIGGQVQLDLDDTGATQGIVFGSTADVNLYRSAASTLRTDTALIVGTQLSLPTTGSTGGLVIGADTNLYRSDVNTLKTDDSFVVGVQLQIPTSGSSAGIQLGSDVALYRTASNRLNLGDDDIITLPNRAATTNVFLESAVSGDAFYRFQITANGTLQWGDGTATRDTNLYRSAANTLKTDDSLIVSGNLTVDGLTTSNGSVDLGDTAADTITFVGVVDSNIVPDASSTRNFGSASKRWATGYFDTVDATTLSGVVAGGSTSSAIWTVNSDNGTLNAETSALAFETGGGAFNATLQWNASGDAGRVAGYDDTLLFNYPIAMYSEVSGLNQTFTSGSLFSYGQNATHAITQSGAFIGIDLDFSSNITVPNSAAGNQTGIALTLADGGVSATATGLTLSGTVDYGINLTGATIGTAAITLPVGTAAAQGITFGADTNLYRSAADTLKTDDSFTVGTNLTVLGTFDGSAASGSFDSLAVGGGYGSTGVTISNAGNIQANGSLTVDSTSTLTAGFDSNAASTVAGLTVDGSGNLTVSDGLTSLTSSSTTASTKALSASQTGATVGTDYAGYFTNTGAATTNVGLYATATGATNNYAAIFEAGNVGIGTTTPNNKLEVLSSTSPQVRVAYDGSNYYTTGVSLAGAVTFDATGASAGFTFSDSVTANTFASSGATITGGSINGAIIGASNPLAATFTTITVNTGIVPDADDGAYLGQSGTAFSDLFLASGAVINFAASDLTLTHSSNDLRLLGGDLTLLSSQVLGTTTLHFDSSGGESNPDGYIAVEDATASGIFGFSTTAGNPGIFKIYTNDSNDFLAMGTMSSQPVVFGTNNVERMRILSGGNVGIGDTTPDAVLDIEGTVAATAAGTHRAFVVGSTISGTVASATTTFDAAQIAWTQNMTGGSNTITDGTGLRVANPTITFGAISNNYGIRVDAQTSGTGDYGIRIDAADTATLWLSGNADNTTEGAGIQFGASRDTNLYRGAASVLKTDDQFFTTFASSSALKAATTTTGSIGIELTNSFSTLNIANRSDLSGGLAVRLNAATDLMTLSTAGQLAVPVTGSAGGLLIGGDAQLYRSAANTLATDDNVTLVGLTGRATALTLNSPDATYDSYLRFTETGDALVDYQLYHSAAGSLLGLWSTNIDGVSGNGDILTIADGTNDVKFTGGIATDGGTAPIAGIQIGADVLISRGAANRLDLASGDSLNLVSGNIDVAGTYRQSANDLMIQGTGQASSKVWRIYTEGSVAGKFGIYDVANVAYRLEIDGTTGQVQLPATGSTAGLLIGGDTNLYRSAADTLTTDDTFTTNGAIVSATTLDAIRINNSGANQVYFEAQNTVGTLEAGVFPSGISYVGSVTADNFQIVAHNTIAATFDSGQQLQLPTTGSGAGLLIGGDTQLYRGTADRLDLASGDSFNVVNGQISLAYTDTTVGAFTTTRGTFSNVTASPALASTNAFIALNGSVTATTENIDNIAVGVMGEAYASHTVGTIPDLWGVRGQIGSIGVGGTLTNGVALIASNSAVSAGTITNGYGLLVKDQTGASNDYGIAIEGADTQALWISSAVDTTDAANGIAFGLSRDTNLYRSAANTLVTDDSFRIGNTASNTSELLLDSKAATTTEVLRTSVQGDASARLTLGADGKISWGDGTSAVDTQLYRGAADRLDLASGDSLNIVNGTQTITKTVAVDTYTPALSVFNNTADPNPATNSVISAIEIAGASGLPAEQRTYVYDRMVGGTGGHGYLSGRVLRFEVGYAALGARTLAGEFSNVGQFALPVTGSTAGLLIGGDTQLFRGAANRLDLASGDSLNIVSGNLSFAAASDIVTPSNTSSAFDITDGTTSYYKLDTRTTVSGVTAHMFNSPARTVADGATSSTVLFRTQSGNITYTGPTQITDLQELNVFAGNTLLATNPLTIDKVTTIRAVAPVESTNLTITDASAIRVLNTSGTPSNQYGLYIEDMTTGTADYGIAIAGADTAALWISSAVDTTDAANGIAFGLSRDTNLYRSAANTLKTDDLLFVANITSSGTALFGTEDSARGTLVSYGQGTGQQLGGRYQVQFSADYDTTTNSIDMTAWEDDLLFELSNGVDLAMFTNEGSLFLNDTANTLMTLGITINQGANDNEIITFKSSDVLHALTAMSEADSYGRLSKSVSASGGLNISGLTEATVGIDLRGLVTTTDSTKSAAGSAAILLTGGGNNAALAADSNLVAIQNYGSTKWIADADGDTWQSGTLTTVGNVGIGTAATTSTLVVSGSPSGHLSQFTNGSSSNGSAAVYAISNGGGSSGPYYGVYGTATTPGANYGGYFTITSAIGKTGYALYADAGAGAGTEYAGAFLNGNVGIGTATPGESLSVYGTEPYAVVGPVTTHHTLYSGHDAQVTPSIEVYGNNAEYVGLNLVNNKTSGSSTIALLSFANENIGLPGTDIRLVTIGAFKDGAENSGYVAFSTMNAGTIAEKARIDKSGQLQVSTTGSSAGILIGGDTQLYRSGANQLSFGAGDNLVMTGASAGDTLVQTQVTGDSVTRFLVDTNGGLFWGPGNAARDVNLYRSAANTLSVASGDSLYLDSGQLRVRGTGGHLIMLDKTDNGVDEKKWDFAQGATTFLGRAMNDAENSTSNWLTVTRSGMTISSIDLAATTVTIPGSGGLTIGGDANLYRSAADILKTDDSFVAATKLGVGQSGIDANVVAKIAGSTSTAGSGGSILGIFGGTITATANGDSAETIYASTTIAKGGFTNLNAYGIWIDANAQSGAGTIANAYGLNVAAQTIGTNNYGVKIDAASTQTLWVSGNADNTTAAAGIAFGSSRDTNLYRSAANALRTDDSITVGASIVLNPFGAGSGTELVLAGDTNLYRSAANTLKTDDSFVIASPNVSGTTTSSGFSVSANSVTTGTAAYISATGLTSGKALDIVGTLQPSNGAAGYGQYITVTNSPTVALNTATGLNVEVDDSTTLNNQIRGIQSQSTLQGNAAKTAYGFRSSVSSLSTTADTLYGIELAGSAAAAISTGTRNMYGVYSGFNNAVANTGGTVNNYGGYFTPFTQSVQGGTTNQYALYTINSASHSLDAGTVNNYGLYIDNGTSTTNGTSTKYGIYVAAQTGADSNYGARIDAAATQTLWISANADNTTTAAGIVFGASADTNLYRSGANTLATSDNFALAGGVYLANANTATWGLNLRGGAGTYDVNLYWGATDVLATDDSLQIGVFSTANTTAVCWDNAGASLLYDCNGSATDLAELYGTSDPSIEAADIVVSAGESEEMLDPNEGGRTSRAFMAKATTPYESGIIGVISTNPNQVYGEDGVFAESDNPRPVSLAGRVPVKVTTQNGPIRTGDAITSSSIPGVGMKATEAGRVVGIALGSYENENPGEVGSVVVFVNTSWWSPTSAGLALDASSTQSQSVESVALTSIEGLVTSTIDGLRTFIFDGAVMARGAFAGLFNLSGERIGTFATSFISSLVNGGNEIIADSSKLKQEASADGTGAVQITTYSLQSSQQEILISGTGMLRACSEYAAGGASGCNEVANNLGFTMSVAPSDVAGIVAFAPEFSALLDNSADVRVLITPTDQVAGTTYVSGKSVRGFVVAQSNAQDAGSTFDWIVIARIGNGTGAAQLEQVFIENNVIDQQVSNPPVESVTEPTPSTDGSASTTDTSTADPATATTEPSADSPTSPEPTPDTAPSPDTTTSTSEPSAATGSTDSTTPSTDASSPDNITTP